MADVSVSIIVVAYNIPREISRTLHSLSSAYQRDAAAEDYEVLVLDNGSAPPLDREFITSFGPNFRLIRIDNASTSPAAAVNRGLAESRGHVVGVLIDGARIVTPGLLFFARHAASLYETSVVTVLGWYLGPDLQRISVQAGYDQPKEDALLNSIDWPSDGYRLFEIATFDESSVDGWFRSVSESNALFLTRESWRMLGGLDERFKSPGGGLLNLDTYRRAVEMPGARAVILLGEATFHQLHGGVATNSPAEVFSVRFQDWMEEYATIRGAPWAHPKPTTTPTYLGTLPRSLIPRFQRATAAAADTKACTVSDHEATVAWAKSLDKELNDLRHAHARAVADREATVAWAKSLDKELQRFASRPRAHRR